MRLVAGLVFKFLQRLQSVRLSGRALKPIAQFVLFSIFSIAILPACSLDSRISTLESNVSAKSSGAKITFLLAETDFEENFGTAIVEIHSDRTLTSDLNFSVSVSGSATSTDYSLPSPGTAVTLSSGASSTQIKINIVDDVILESSESIILTIPSSDLYQLGVNPKIQVNIKPSDQPVCDSAIATNFGGGLGTSLNPYRICSIAQWNYFAGTVSSWSQEIKLESDLDFASLTFAQVKQVGTITDPFTGIFDGNNFKIKNINVNGAAAEFGLFNRTNGNVTIKNLILKDISYTSTLQSAILIHEHGTGGTLTLQNISILNVVSATNNSGLVNVAKGPLVVSGLTINGFATRCADGIAAVVGTAEKNGTFSSITGQSISIIGSTHVTNYGNSVIVGSTTTSAVPRNLTYTDITLNLTLGAGSSTYYAGALGGGLPDSSVTVTNCQVSGTLSGRKIGGLFGEVRDYTSSLPIVTITNSSFNGTIASGNSIGAGILADVSVSSLTIQNSFSKGSVAATSGYAAGILGVINSASASIANSYSTMAVSSTSVGGSAGGLATFVGAGTTLTVTNSYHSGAATVVTGYVGCIAAYTTGATVTATNVYYNNTLCAANAINSAGLAGITGQSTAAMQPSSAFASWLTSVWVFASGAYPKLIWEP